MVATLFRLKIRVLEHTLRRDVWRVVVLVIGALWALSAVPSVVMGMMWLSGESHDSARDLVVIGGAILVAGWGVVPLLIPGMDDSLEITRFATSGRSALRLAPGLLVAGLISLPALFILWLSLAPLIAWRDTGAGTVVVTVLASPLVVATCVLASRLATEISGRVLSSRRAREMGGIVGVTGAAIAVFLMIRLGAVGLEGVLERVPTVAQVLSWTPFGLVWAAPASMAHGDTSEAIVQLVLALMWVVAGFVAWVWLLQRALTRPPSRAGQVRHRRDAMLPRTSMRRPGLVAAGAIARRGLRYWVADARYMGSMVSSVVTPVFIVLLIAGVVGVPAGIALSMGSFMAGTLGWGRHNDVAYDGSAFWLHVAARVPGWADRLGRTLATAVWAVPLTVVVSLIGVGVSGRWDLAPAAVGAGVGVLFGGLAVSAVASALLPYPVPEAGANPYTVQMGTVGASLVAQLVSSAATGVVCVPILALFSASLWWSSSFAVVTLAVGVLGGALVLAAAIVVGGRVFDARAPLLLARLT